MSAPVNRKIIIRRACRGDVEAIAEIAREHALRGKTEEQAKQEGYLISGYSADQYEGWLGGLTVAECEGEILAFTLAFPKAELTGKIEDSDQVFAAAAGGDFILIKQVGVVRKAQRTKVGSLLYEALLRDVQVPVFAPILSHNGVSAAFHTFRQFVCVARYVGSDGSARGLWCRWPVAVE